MSSLSRRVWLFPHTDRTRFTWTRRLSGLMGTQCAVQRSKFVHQTDKTKKSVNKGHGQVMPPIWVIWQECLCYMPFEALLQQLLVSSKFQTTAPPPPLTPLQEGGWNYSQSEVRPHTNHSPVQLIVNKWEVHVPECSLSCTLQSELWADMWEQRVEWGRKTEWNEGRGGRLVLQEHLATWSCGDTVAWVGLHQD